MQIQVLLSIYEKRDRATKLQPKDIIKNSQKPHPKRYQLLDGSLQTTFYCDFDHMSRKELLYELDVLYKAIKKTLYISQSTTRDGWHVYCDQKWFKDLPTMQSFVTKLSDKADKQVYKKKEQMFRLPLVDKESNKENIYNAFYKYDGHHLESLVLNEDMIVHYVIYQRTKLQEVSKTSQNH